MSLRADNHSSCRSCQAEITWVKTSRGKNMPVDGHVIALDFEPGEHISHWSTCPEAEKIRKPRLDDGGGPGRRTPLDQIQARPLNLNFGEPTDRVKELLAMPRQAPSAPVQALVKQIYDLSRDLLELGISAEQLQAMSLETCGLASAKHIHCAGVGPLEQLRDRLFCLGDVVSSEAHACAEGGGVVCAS